MESPLPRRARNSLLDHPGVGRCGLWRRLPLTVHKAPEFPEVLAGWAAEFPALQGLDHSESVLYIGTFSKVLFPSLRIGYLVLPPSLVPIFGRAKWLSDRHLPLLDQRVLTDFINEGHLERHIRKLRSHYDRCRQVLVEELQTQLGDRATILGEKAGIHLMVRLHTGLKDAEIVQQAAQVGVGLVSAQPHYLQTYGGGEFILGYGELSQEQIREGVDRLSNILAPI